MLAVEIRFVKAGPTSITLDLHVPAHLEHADSQLRIDKFELQWREAHADAVWATASSSLKLRRRASRRVTSATRDNTSGTQ